MHCQVQRFQTTKLGFDFDGLSKAPALAVAIKLKYFLEQSNGNYELDFELTYILTILQIDFYKPTLSERWREKWNIFQIPLDEETTDRKNTDQPMCDHFQS